MKVFKITDDEWDLRERLLDDETRNKILVDWVRVDSQMRNGAGQYVSVWNAEFPMPRIGSLLIVWPGCCYGQVVDYSLKLCHGTYEKAVWVRLDNGSFVKVVGCECKLLSDEERVRMDLQNAEFRKRLAGAVRKVETQRSEHRSKAVPGSHLVDRMLEEAASFSVKDGPSFYKITGHKKGAAVYLAVKGGRVDLSGFCVDHAAVSPMSEDEAKERHLGRVRGQINFSRGDEMAMSAFKLALEELK